MKKLMIVAAVALAAAVSQAATVSWQSNTGTAKTFLVDDANKQIGKGDFGTLGVDFVLVALAGDDLTAYNAGTLNLAYDEGRVLSTGAISNSTKGTQKGSFTTDFGFTYGSSNPIANGDVLAVLITDGQTMQNVTYADGTKMTDKMTVAGLENNTYAQTFNFATAGNFTAQIESVPEPTSGVLLLLGMAGLALRRRRA